VARRFVYTSDPESYTSGSIATGRAILAAATDAGSSVICGDLKHTANDA
jgi:hypothetical protein